jgi:hypothetical protein
MKAPFFTGGDLFPLLPMRFFEGGIAQDYDENRSNFHQ